MSGTTDATVTSHSPWETICGFNFNGHDKRKETYKCSLILLLALPRESQGYTALIGAPPKVQPIFLLALPRESLGYTAFMDAPPKVQPVFVTST